MAVLIHVGDSGKAVECNQFGGEEAGPGRGRGLACFPGSCKQQRHHQSSHHGTREPGFYSSISVSWELPLWLGQSGRALAYPLSPPKHGGCHWASLVPWQASERRAIRSQHMQQLDPVKEDLSWTFKFSFIFLLTKWFFPLKNLSPLTLSHRYTVSCLHSGKENVLC